MTKNKQHIITSNCRTGLCRPDVCVCVCVLWSFGVNLPHECKAAALAGESVTGNIDVADLAASFENATQILGRRAVGQIVHLCANVNK